MANGTFQNDPGEKLLKIFSLALRTNNIDLRDSIISYLAQTELPGGADLIREYIRFEDLDWLREYAKNVMQHLERIEVGLDSTPPRETPGQWVCRPAGCQKINGEIIRHLSTNSQMIRNLEKLTSDLPGTKSSSS